MLVKSEVLDSANIFILLLPETFLLFLQRRNTHRCYSKNHVLCLVWQFWLGYGMEMCAEINLNLVYSMRAPAVKPASFICKLLMNGLMRGTKRDCSFPSLIVFSLCLYDDSSCSVISAHLSPLLISSTSLIQFPHGPVDFAQFCDHWLTPNCHLANGCCWSPQTEPEIANEQVQICHHHWEGAPH